MKKLLISIVLCGFFSMAFVAEAWAQSVYYSNSISSLKGKALRDTLHELAQTNHRSLTYKEARQYLFGDIHLEDATVGYKVKDVYCRKNFTRKVGPMRIPSHEELNCEHTWPQSKFSGSYTKTLQKGDLHHLYPTDSRANSTRGNHEFANVDEGRQLNNCESSWFGTSGRSSSTYFEPPNEHKGNVARAIFYFAVRYNMEVSTIQENALREWHQLDPVDQVELQRNEKVFQIQGNRNPFIDRPELVSQISNF